MLTNEERNEPVVVDTCGNRVRVYDFTASSWRGPRTVEDVLTEARTQSADSIRRITQIIECGKYETDLEYWETQLKQEKARTFSVMTYGAFLDLERETLLSSPMVEITKQDFNDALDALPPLGWHTRNGIEEFCCREMYTGTYTTQYAFDKTQNRYFSKMVDYTDPATWFSTILTQH